MQVTGGTLEEPTGNVERNDDAAVPCMIGEVRDQVNLQTETLPAILGAIFGGDFVVWWH